MVVFIRHRKSTMKFTKKMDSNNQKIKIHPPSPAVHNLRCSENHWPTTRNEKRKRKMYLQIKNI